MRTSAPLVSVDSSLQSVYKVCETLLETSCGMVENMGMNSDDKNGEEKDESYPVIIHNSMRIISTCHTDACAFCSAVIPSYPHCPHPLLLLLCIYI